VILPWWERYPGLLEQQVRGLERAGFSVREDEDARRAGFIKLLADGSVSGQDHHLAITFPDFFPLFRVEVAEYSQPLLQRHQHPVSRFYCLLPRRTLHWDWDSSVADHILQQLPRVLDSASRPASARSGAAEEQYAEPYSDYFQYSEPAALIIDSSWVLPPEADEGDLVIYADPRASTTVPVLRGFVSSISTHQSEVAGEMPDALKLAFGQPQRFTGRWVRLGEPPPVPVGQDYTDLIAAVARVKPHLRNEQPQWVGEWQLDVLGIVFREEVRYGVEGDGFVFLVRARRGRERHVYVCRAMRSGIADLTERIPEVAELRRKKVAVVGLGGIGGPSALELARAGVGELRIVDHDIVDAATSVRHPLGFQWAGMGKARAIAETIQRNSPYTAVKYFRHRIGSVRSTADDSSDLDVVDELLDGVDLVYEATTEHGIQFQLSELARERRIPYVEAWMLNSDWGGLVARIIPDKGRPCWVCLSHEVADLGGESRTISSRQDRMHQPYGCADPTFIGVGFDVAEFALGGVRLAVATLLRSAPGVHYPDPPWDAAVLNIRQADGTVRVPEWIPVPFDRIRCDRLEH
jgi:molybdopterin/thiamine biosynthesis adenylyltransferase